MEVFTKFIISVFTVFLFSFSLHAQLKGEVSQNEFSDYAIAVAPIIHSSNLSKNATKLHKILSKDLEMCGYFHLLNPKSFLEKANTPINKTNFKSWLNVGAQGLVKGKISKNGKNFVLELAFFDVAKGKDFVHKKYTVSQNMLRKAVHKFVFELVYYLTGEKLNFLFSKIAFIEKSRKKYALKIMDFDGGNVKTLIRSSKIILLPDWSADGKKIFFTFYKNNEPDLYAINVKTRRLSLISAQPGLNTSVSAAFDNKTIALRLSKDGNAEIYTMNLITKKLTRMTKNMAIDTAPSFSEDGKQIAFVSNRSGTPQVYRLFVNNPNRVERLTTQGKYNQDPDYSPDGKYIAFTGRDEHYKFDIFLFDLQTRVISRVTQHQGKNETPSFSPDGKLIVFSSDRKGKEAIYVSNLKGDKQIEIYKGKARAVTPCWSNMITDF